MRWLVKYLNEVQTFTDGQVPANESYSPSILLIAQKLQVPASNTNTQSSSLLAEAHFAIKQGDVTTAEHLLRKCIDLDQHMTEAYTTLADFLTIIKNHHDAIQVLKSALQFMPQALPILKRLGTYRNDFLNKSTTRIFSDPTGIRKYTNITMIFRMPKDCHQSFFVWVALTLCAIFSTSASRPTNVYLADKKTP